MNISHYHSVGNNSRVAPASDTNQSKYLTPDYFLPSSHSESYYSKKYVGNSNLNLKSKSSKIARLASAILLSLSFLATAVEVKAQPNKELSTLGQSTIASNQSFLLGNSSASTSTNAPIPPKMPAVSLVGSFNSAGTTPPAPPIAPSMPDFIREASIAAKPEGRLAFLESIRNFGKGALKRPKA